ncbi:hypothetical protein CTI14_28125 [Methylobacterium radiotolerans]|nr:hypothetical protein CTI14_28125 [Methylobacterium radiotolerans]
MDPRLHAGLGDDQRLRLLQEGEDLRRVVHRRPAPAQGRGAGIAEHAEARPLDQWVGFAGDAVLLHAEDEELAVRQPFEEGARSSVSVSGIGVGPRPRSAARSVRRASMASRSSPARATSR